MKQIHNTTRGAQDAHRCSTAERNEGENAMKTACAVRIKDKGDQLGAAEEMLL